MISYDILAIEELQTENGDFLIDESDGYHIENILQAGKGNFIGAPLLGVNIQKYINAPSSSRELKQDVLRELTRDNYKTNKITSSGTIDEIDLNIDATKIK